MSDYPQSQELLECLQYCQQSLGIANATVVANQRLLTEERLVTIYEWVLSACEEVLPSIPSLGERAWRIILKFLSATPMPSLIILDMMAWVGIALAVNIYGRSLNFQSLKDKNPGLESPEVINRATEYMVAKVGEEVFAYPTLIEVCALLAEYIGVNPTEVLPVAWNYMQYCYLTPLIGNHSTQDLAFGILLASLNHLPMDCARQTLLRLSALVGNQQVSNRVAEQLVIFAEEESAELDNSC